MAKRMKFSVVGLPHYTIWHLYEPSVEDIRHMQEMEEEKKIKEAEEAQKAAQQEKLEQEFRNPKAEWEIDGAALHDIITKDEKAAKEKGSQEGQAAKPGKDSSENKKT